jgi:hypothetical protein
MSQEVHLVKTPEEQRAEALKAWIDRIVGLVAVLSAAAAIASAIAAHKDAAQSLRTQQESVASQIAVQQAMARPLIGVEPVTGGRRYIPANKDRTASLSFRVTSKGQTPAIGVSYSISCRPLSAGVQGDIKKTFDVQPHYATLGMLADKDERIIDCLGPFEFDTIADAAAIGIRVFYSDLFSNQYQITYFFYADLVIGGVLVGYEGAPQIEMTSHGKQP